MWPCGSSPIITEGTLHVPTDILNIHLQVILNVQLVSLTLLRKALINFLFHHISTILNRALHTKPLRRCSHIHKQSCQFYLTTNHSHKKRSKGSYRNLLLQKFCYYIYTYKKSKESIIMGKPCSPLYTFHHQAKHAVRNCLYLVGSLAKWFPPANNLGYCKYFVNCKNSS